MSGKRGVTTAVLAAGLVLAGCGGGSSSPRDLADQAGRNIAKVRSGDLHLRFTLGAQRARASTVGVDLSGPFSLSGSGPLASVRLRFSRLAGTRTTTATVISTGREAFVQGRGRTVKLSGAQAESLKSVADGKGASPRLRLGRWLAKAERADGPRLDGAATDRISGPMNVPKALADLVSAGRATPGGEQAAARLASLRDSVQSSSMTVIAGRSDHLLRRLTAEITFAVPPRLRARVGGRYTIVALFDLAIARPNQPIPTPHPPA